MRLRGVKAVLFDKDGTLIDFNATWLAIADRLALEAADGDRAAADALLSRAGLDLASRRFRPDSVFAAGTNAEVVELWYPQLSGPERQRRLADVDILTAQWAAAEAVPLQGAAEAIGELHRAGLRLAVATNDSTMGAEQTLQALGVATLFDAVYGYDSVANPKPAPDIVQSFCALTGLKPGDIAMVGDNRHDMEMARAGGAGLAIGVLSGTGTRESLAPLADVILDSVADLPGLLGLRG